MAGFEASDLGLEPVGYYYGIIADGQETDHGDRRRRRRLEPTDVTYPKSKKMVITILN